ncbi:MAG: SRPBCC family protein [Actinobacteria bacterium]|nr:SRPBCC family protein [Actinomycetota bacterium]
MIGFQFTEHIERPPLEVFAVLADPTRSVDYVDGVVRSAKLTDGPLAEGSVIEETRRIKGKESTGRLQILALDPPSTFAITSEAEGITATYHYRLHPDKTGTRVEWTCELEAGGLRRMMLPLVAAITKKEDGEHLVRLKAYVESQPASKAAS